MRLGEALAISFPHERVDGCSEDVSFSFSRFDDPPVPISKKF